MAPDSAVTGRTGANQTVMAAVDDGKFLLADVSRDDAWVAIRRREAPDLSAYR